MTIEIYYFSGTGNSLVIARDLACHASPGVRKRLYTEVY